MKKVEDMSGFRGEQTHRVTDESKRATSLAAEVRADQMLPEPISGYFLLVPPQPTDDVINLRSVMRTIAQRWKPLTVTALVCGLAMAGLSLTMRDWYRAEVQVAPVVPDTADQHSGLENELGGIASIVGVELPGEGGKKAQAYATLISKGFAREFITSQNLMPILFADKWDPSTNNWRKGVKPPSLEAGVKLFTSSVRAVVQDKKTGMVKVIVDWYSPELAAAWANRTIEMANDDLRAVAVSDANRSIEYLNKELAKTNVVDMQHAIYRVIEEQVNTAMLANVQREYAFKVIDPAVVPAQKYGPHRSILAIVAAAVGFFIALAVLFIRGAMRSPKDQAHSRPA
jgi:capsular polysaccharide biosynthesis protein